MNHTNQFQDACNLIKGCAIEKLEGLGCVHSTDAIAPLREAIEKEYPKNNASAQFYFYVTTSDNQDTVSFILTIHIDGQTRDYTAFVQDGKRVELQGT